MTRVMIQFQYLILNQSYLHKRGVFYLANCMHIYYKIGIKNDIVILYPQFYKFQFCLKKMSK